MDTIEVIISYLNKPPFNKNFNVTSFDSLPREDVLQILSDILSEICNQNRVDIRSEDADQTISRICNILYVLKYPPCLDTSLDLVGQNLQRDDKTAVYSILAWLISNQELLKTRAYLARFLVRIEIPNDILGDSDIASLHQQYLQRIEEFKNAHRENVSAKGGNKISVVEMRSDGVTMEKEREIVTNRIYQIQKKVNNFPNSSVFLQSCRNLRTEYDRKKKLAWQIQEETVNARQCQQRFFRLSQQLQELQKRSVGLSPQALIKNLEEEIYVTSYIVNEKLPRELNRQKKIEEIYENLAYSNNVTSALNDALNVKIQDLSQEINQLMENRFNSSNNANDKTILYRQQAAIIARKKDTVAEKFSMLKSQLQEVYSKLQSKQSKLEEIVGDSGIILKDNEKFQEYVNKLRTRSSIYKRCRTDLAVLKSEYGVLCRTYDILRAKANAFGGDVAITKVSDRVEEDESQKQSGDALLALFTQLTARTAAQKAKLVPLVGQVKPMKDRVRELGTIHTEKKRIYDRTNIALSTNSTELSNEVKNLHEEHTKIILETNLLRSKIRAAEVDLARAKNEFQASLDKNNSAPLVRDKLNQKISESDKINKLLKDEQRTIRKSEQKLVQQKNFWNNVNSLLRLKIRSWRETEKSDLLLRTEQGAETLILR